MEINKAPLSQTQLGIYIDSIRNEGEQVYHIPFLFRVNGVEDAQRLVWALEKALQNYQGPSVRITTGDDGEPYMTAGEAPRVEMMEMSESELLAAPEKLLEPFDLEGGSLATFKVIKAGGKVYLFTDVHHVIFDGYSRSLFFDAVDKAYRGEDIPAEIMTIMEVADEEAKSRGTASLVNAREAMTRLLSGAERIEFPADLNGDTDEVIILDTPLGISPAQYTGFCKSAGMPVSVPATAAMGLLLSELCQKSDVTFATVYHGRKSGKVALTFAMMVKTLPVRIAITPGMTVAELFAQAKANLGISRDNDLYSYADTAAEFGLNSDFLFAYQGDFIKLPAINGKPVEEFSVRHKATSAGVTAELFLTSDGLSLRLSYRAARYSGILMKALAESYATLLSGIIASRPTDKVCDIPFMSPERRDEVIMLGKGGKSLADPAATIPSSFRETARKFPEKTAVVFNDRRLSYSELDRLSNSLARELRDRYGVCAGTAVGVLIERSELMTLLPLAIMKAGGAYMPLDPHFPSDRLTFMVEDAGLNLIIEDDGLVAGLIPGYGGDVFPASRIAGLPEAHDTADLDSAPASPMVILYTSGSTGKPKGVTLSQRNILNYCAAYINLVSLTHEDTVGAYAAFGFDAHMMDIYPALLAGSTLHIFNPELRLDLTAMHEYMGRERISVMFMTTQIAWQMATLFEFPSLRALLGGGEKLPPLDRLPYDFYNLYGPTECSVAATAYHLQGHTDGKIIGKALPGYEVRVVDRQLRPMPVGVPGELLIMGDGVGAGYLNRPDLTAEKFVEVDGQPAYHTGDQARFLPSGEIEFIGRLDGLVKLRGLRIELGEIEAVASRHESVQSFVAAVKEIGGMDNLIGYYTVKDGAGQEVSPEELRDFMGQSLTEFMVPSAMIKLDRMPLTPNGKVDRRALPVPEMAVSEIVAPATDDETRLFDIVAEVLKHSDFGVTTNLLSVGLTSLMAMRLVAAIMKRTGVMIKAKVVMSSPTVRELAPLLAGAAQASAPSASAASPRRRYYPLTENQRGVYLDWEMNREALQYNIPQAFGFAAGTDAERLREAVLKVVASHPGLMTRFVMRSGDIMQERRDSVIPDIPVIELESEPGADFFQSRIRPFNLLEDCLFRCEIFRFGEKVYMLRDTHHIIFDGVSAMVFQQELRRAYDGEALEAETYSALDRALDEKSMMESDEMDKAAEWFDSLVGDSESTSYPHSSVPDNDIAGGMGRISLPMPSADIKAFCAKGGITRSNYLLGAFMQLLHRLTREETVQITTVNNGRADLRLLNDTGMFVKTLPVVSRCKDISQSPLKFAEGIQAQFLTSQDYDFYPFTALVESKGVRPEIMFVFEGGIDLSGESGSGLSADDIHLALDTAKVPLTVLVFEPSADEYSLIVEYDTSLYNKEDMSVLLEMLRTLSLSLATAASLKDGVMANADQQQLLSRIRNGEIGPVPYPSFHGAVEMRADATPQAPALVACDRRLDYSEFDAECNRIANALISRGVKRGDRVVILLPRKASLITSIYGVMKTGAAYIPCDPDYPADRIRLITEDSDARYIITTADRMELYPGKAIDVDELLRESDDSRPDVKVEPEDVAYMIYTSGSTGRPKGVMIPHRAITNYLYGYYHQFYEPNPDLKVQMLLVTISFDASLVDMGGALTSGHCLVLANEEECKDVTLLAKLMLDNKVDSFDVTPSRLDAMLELPDFRTAVARCRLLNIGGEGFTNALIKKLDDAGFKGLAVNEYGPTETAVGSNHAIVTSCAPIVAGPPFYNESNRIVDAWGAELPVGAVGELYIFGRSVGLGYNNLPDKTALAFVDYHGERGYRTGDLARWTPEGEVRILGRIDHQVKLRGLRIELGEIENVALTFDGIKSVAADVREVNKIQHLCLYYTSSGPVDAGKLRSHLAASLTEYMVPDAYTEIAEMPLTPNGKTNRKALPEPNVAPLTEYVEPADGLEKSIADVFAKILRSERVGANDDFFQIGGTSISAIKVVAALAAAGHEISYKNVFSERTPRALAALIGGAVSGGDCKRPQPAATPAPLAASEYSGVLDSNTIDAFRSGELRPVGNVLLTGATGFMGIHMLHELLVSSDACVYCLLRGSGGFPAASRLRTLLFYYFDDTFDEAFDSGRLVVVEGDVTKPVPDCLAACDIDTVINCAANVKHFSAGDDIEQVNVESVRHLVDFALSKSSRLIHVSTVSIAGESVDGYPDPATLLTERMFDFGQSLANQYVHSKYEAEKLILAAVRDKGLDAKIMRVGNLSARGSDGEFQINFRSNAFMGTLRAYAVMGCAPFNALDNSCEFSPIDEVCRAILALGTVPGGMVVFQPTNNHRLPLGDILHILGEIGVNVDFVEPDEFLRRQREVMADPLKVDALQPLLAYVSTDSAKVSFIGYNSTYTNQILYRLGFRWNYTSREYVLQFLKAIKGLNFFDE